jgi:hypothetical protein
MRSPLLPFPAADFQPLADALHQLAAKRPLMYLANPGNWGAALTREATLHFFQAYQLSVEEIAGLTPWQLVRGKWRGAVLLFGGGGAWSAEFPGGLKLVSRALRMFAEIVVLPSTLGVPVSLPRCQLWARDRFSSLKQVPQARFCHDLGLFPRSLPDIVPQASRGEFFRNDTLASPQHESPTGSAPHRPPDLSSQGTERSPLRPFLEAIGQYEEVHTDRVHIAIAACLLGRRCHVYPTRAPLLRDLFFSSLGPYFPQAVWHGDPLTK